MPTVPQVFDQLVRNLELTNKEQEEASRQQNVVRNNLRTSLDIEQDFLSGSYRRRTAIRPLKDIDLVLVLAEAKHRELRSDPPQKTLALVQSALARAYPNAAPPRMQARSVNIEFRGTDIGYDVVPAFRHAAGGYLIPDRERGSWIRSDPELHHQACITANQAAGNMLNPLIKMAKALNARHHRPLRSFHLEVMAYSAFSGRPAALDSGLHRLILHLADRVLQSCPDPAKLGPNIDQGMTSEQRAQIRRVLDGWAQSAEKAIRATQRGDIEAAHATWSALFGPLYPAFRAS
jgi:hypothetical protein